MKIPFWKKWLSFLFDVHIETRSSEHNPVLQVDLVRGRLQLCSENAIYSFADLYGNFRQAFQQLEMKRLEGGRFLVLGFGLGSIPYMLEKKSDLRFHYTGVEIDEEVLSLANKYVLSELDSPMEMICADAHSFVELCEQQFDVIAVDLFNDDVIPAKFETKAFLQRTLELLNPDGLLLYNRMTLGPNDELNARRFFDNQFKTVFEDGIFLEVKTNWILLNNSNYLLPGT